MNKRILQLALIVFLTVLVIYILTMESKLFHQKYTLEPLKPLTLRNKKVELPWWDGGECSNRTPIIYYDEVQGHCGRRAWALGAGQKVVSMCLFGNDAGYFKGLEENLNRMNEIYPGYKLRLHVNPSLYKEFLCRLLMKYDHLYVCDTRDMPSGLGNINPIHAMVWRLSPMGDPQVDIILIRDSDTKLSKREMYAVQEWLESKTTLHVMNDYPLPNRMHSIAGGMWAVRSDLGKTCSMNIEMKKMLNIIREKIFNKLTDNHLYWHDMYALTEFLYSILRNDMVRHDSFLCKEYPGSWPWPSQRNGTTMHVGEPFYRPGVLKQRIANMKCPIECRPPNHKDWEHC